MKKNYILVFLAGLTIFILTACSSQPTLDSAEKTAPDSKKTVVTALYYSTLPTFEALVESVWEDIDLQIEQSSPSGYNSDTLRRLQNNHGKDLIFTSIPNGEVADYMLDLSANSFTTSFTSSVMEIIQHNGKTIWLPMPSVYKGLIVNKTLAEELGKGLPASQQELLALMGAAKASGIGADEDGFVFATADIDGISVGELIIGTMVPDFLGTMEGERWTADFQMQKVDAQGNLEEPLSFFFSLAEQGYTDPSRLYMGVKNVIPVAKRMASRKMTVCYGYSNILQSIQKENDHDEFVMIPFLSGKGNEPWITTSPASYLGINAAAVKDPQKLDAALRVLELFSSPEGQAAILQDTNSSTSYLIAEVEGSGAADTGLERYVENGYVYNMNRFNADMIWLFGSNMVKVSMGNMEISQALASIDRLNKEGAGSYAENHSLLGSVEADLLYENYNTRTEETALGNLIADSVVQLTGANIAFVNGGSIRASLYAGDVYTSDLAEVCPYDNKIIILDVTGETIVQMLENSIAQLYYQKIPSGRFLQVSGLHYSFSVDKSTENILDENHTVPAKTRLLSVTLPDGSALKKEETYRIAVTDYMCGSSGYLDGGDAYTMLNIFDDAVPKADGAVLVEDTGKTYADTLISYFQAHSNENIRPVLEGRITVQEENKK